MMVGGMATIAGGVFAVYAGMGVEAGHLLAASFMANAHGPAMAKILPPKRNKAKQPMAPIKKCRPKPPTRSMPCAKAPVME